MDKYKHYNIALVLYTQGLDYDDRIRKEMLSVMEIYPNVVFKIFAVESKNREEEGVTSYGVPYRIPYLKTRDKYPSATHKLAKAFDFYRSIKKDLKKFDAIWCADIETFLFVLFIRKPILWDLHELPSAFMRGTIQKTLFKCLERKVKVMVHANEPRLEYLKELGMIKHPNKQHVLRNYPQFNEIDSEYDNLYQDFVKWKGEDRCVYLQGLSQLDRAPYETVASVLESPGLKAVVIGGFNDSVLKRLNDTYGVETVKQRVFFTGRIKQKKTPQFIHQCFATMVFYQKEDMNNYYCEPNRLFQNLINGNPVVVGCNPPMKDVVERFDVGIVLKSDGTDLNDNKDGLRMLMTNYDHYKVNLKTAKKSLLWDNQNEEIRVIVNELLS
jgi:hypothetical protein